MTAVASRVDEAKGLLERAKASVPWRAWERYGKARGPVLAGGMGYAALFSLIPAIAVGFFVFGLIVGDNEDLELRMANGVNDSVGTPVIITRAGGPGIVTIDRLVGGGTLTIAGVVGIVGLLFTGFGWLDAMREGIRAMFGQPPMEDNPVKGKGRDLLVLVGIGLLVLLSTAAGFAVTAVTGWLLSPIGLDDSTVGSIVLGALSALVVLAVDVGIYLLLFRTLAGLHLPREDLVDAALFGGIALGVLKLTGGLLLQGATHNKFLATFGVLLGLLVWLNLIARVTLVAASWGAIVALDRGHLTELQPVTGTFPVERLELDERPGAFQPVVSPRAADRVSIVAGAVLGVAALGAARAGANAVRAVRDAARDLTTR
ncbi:YihY/virulence factor BrkB family protein [Spongisporangium articulatum]|uniref:YihY/virulence factor BrkB family protein n=1 Tax=Spongisporangium articulatum TaxID=3362603 RepID=A0ABW8APE3_9ACTN